MRGKQRFVVVNIEHYNYLRECELSAAIIESEADIKAGWLIEESAQAHLARLELMIKDQKIILINVGDHQ